MTNGRPTSYKIRKTFAHAMELDLFKDVTKVADKAGRNINEIMNTAIIWYLKSKGIKPTIDIPEYIQMMDGILKCTRCADTFTIHEDALSHKCVKIFDD